MRHLVEIWEMTGERRIVSRPACLSCGWVGSGGSRLIAEREGRAHEEGEGASRMAAAEESYRHTETQDSYTDS
jgi:hypothetical protein